MSFTRQDSLSHEQWERLGDEISSLFPSAAVSEEFADRRTYTIPQAAVESLAEAFRSLERRERCFDVEMALDFKLNLFVQ